jgi:hypothetical protein
MLAYILGASPDASRKHAAREFLAEHGYEWWNTSQRIDNLCAQLRNEQARPPPYQEAAHPVDGTATDVALLLAAVMAEPLTAFVGSFKAVEDDAYKQWKESTSATKSTHPPTMQDWSIWRRHNSPRHDSGVATPRLSAVALPPPRHGHPLAREQLFRSVWAPTVFHSWCLSKTMGHGSHR